MGMTYHASAPAKINLGLHVLRRRPDGFHDLETVFLRIGWADHLSATAADTLTLTCSDPALPTDERNLCIKAARLLAEQTGCTQGAHLHLDKRLPVGAGLGGGSSDAATTLRLLTKLWNLDVTEQMWYQMGQRLGSDVSFFMGESACLYAEGRGEILRPMDFYNFPFHLVVVMPPVQISTAAAYGWITPRDHPRSDLQDILKSNDLDRWKKELVNDFEPPILGRFPVIAEVKNRLLDAGAGYAALSGSGAAVFGVFETLDAAQQAATTCADMPHWVG